MRWQPAGQRNTTCIFRCKLLMLASPPLPPHVLTQLAPESVCVCVHVRRVGAVVLHTSSVHCAGSDPNRLISPPDAGWLVAGCSLIMCPAVSTRRLGSASTSTRARTHASMSTPPSSAAAATTRRRCYRHRTAQNHRTAHPPCREEQISDQTPSPASASVSDDVLPQ